MILGSYRVLICYVAPVIAVMVYCGEVVAVSLHRQKILFRVINLSDRRGPIWKIHLESPRN